MSLEWCNVNKCFYSSKTKLQNEGVVSRILISLFLGGLGLIIVLLACILALNFNTPFDSASFNLL
jgi:hypothetical protein